MQSIITFFLVLLFSGCSMLQGPTTEDAESLRNQQGNGIYKNYNDSLNQGKSDIDTKHLIGLKESRVYDLSEPGVPIRQPAKTRTYWVAPRAGGMFMTHGGWVTLVVEKEGWVGTPLRGRYLPTAKIGGAQQSFQRLSDKKKKGKK